MKLSAYSFRLPQEKIRELKGLPPKEKLHWLEDANHFIGIAVSEKKLKRWERLKAIDEGQSSTGGNQEDQGQGHEG